MISISAYQKYIYNIGYILYNERRKNARNIKILWYRN